MHPILFELGPVTIYSYGVLLASAYLIGLYMAVRRANAAGVDGNKVMDLEALWAADGVHPTPAGHVALAAAWLRLVAWRPA